MLDTSTNTIYNGICVCIIPSTDQLVLYSTIYYLIVYYGGQVYGHDGGYKGGNSASRVY